MLVDSYSTYVNSFAAAMEEIKSVQRMKPAFSDFLKVSTSLVRNGRDIVPRKASTHGAVGHQNDPIEWIHLVLHH